MDGLGGVGEDSFRLWLSGLTVLSVAAEADDDDNDDDDDDDGDGRSQTAAPV